MWDKSLLQSLDHLVEVSPWLDISRASGLN